MKAKEVKLDNSVNELIFKNGIKNPPNKIRVSCSKEDNKVKVTLVKVGE